MALFGRAEISLLLHPMKNRVKRARADLVAVAPELLDHGEAVQGAFGRVMEQMQANQPGVEFTVYHFDGAPAVRMRYRLSISPAACQAGAGRDFGECGP